jgi:hypothetical protein
MTTEVDRAARRPASAAHSLRRTVHPQMRLGSRASFRFRFSLEIVAHIHPAHPILGVPDYEQNREHLAPPVVGMPQFIYLENSAPSLFLFLR